MRPWEQFFRDKMIQIFNRGGTVIDVGGGLRIIKEKNNRYDPKREWLRPYLSKVDYKILDAVDTYHPDIVGNLHNLPFDNNSIDSIICIAVLQHVEEPVQAIGEIYRVLKSGGQAFVYVPFLYYYHAEKDYYKDFWRFTKDGLEYLSQAFEQVEIQSVRGAIETWIKISPLGRFKFINWVVYMLDIVFNKLKSNQVSGYNIFLTK